VTPDYDDRKWLFKGLDPKMIAGELKAVPDCRFITVAEDMKILSVTARVLARRNQSDAGERRWSRWNDYGIGLFCKAT